MQNNNFKKKSLIQWFSEAKFYHSKKNPSKTIEILLKRIFIHLEKINDNKFIIKSFILCLVCYYEIGKFKEIVDFYETFVFPYKNNFEIVCIVSKTLHNLKDYEKEIQVLQNYMDDDYESELRQAFCSFKNYLLARAYRKIGELNLALEKIILSLENGVIIKLNMLSKETFNVLKVIKNYNILHF